MKTKTGKIISWLLTGIIALIFIASAIFKLTGGNPEMVQGLGGATNLTILGVLELIIVALFLYTRTGVVGSLLMIAYMGGAMAVHFVTGQSLGVVLITQILIWIAAAVRFPEITKRLIVKA